MGHVIGRSGRLHCLREVLRSRHAEPVRVRVGAERAQESHEPEPVREIREQAERRQSEGRPLSACLVLDAGHLSQGSTGVRICT